MATGYSSLNSATDWKKRGDGIGAKLIPFPSMAGRKI